MRRALSSHCTAATYKMMVHSWGRKRQERARHRLCRRRSRSLCAATASEEEKFKFFEQEAVVRPGMVVKGYHACSGDEVQARPRSFGASSCTASNEARTSRQILGILSDDPS